jgi:hypothetical protein
MYDWHQYNDRLVRRGEIFISVDLMENWNKELAVMNRQKRGRRFLFPDSFMKMLGYVRVYFGLPYRQTEGLVRTYGAAVPAVPDYTAIHKRINKMEIRDKPGPTHGSIVLAVDSSGIKVTNRGEWMRRKWGGIKGFLKIHVGIDTQTKQVLALKITDERTHDARPFKGLISESARHGTISSVLGDAAYDSREIFSYLDKRHIVPAIRVRRSSIPRSRGCYSRKQAVISQLSDYRKWARSVSYGKRWIAESVFSAIKRMFGEEVRSRKKRNMMREMALKISLYNTFMAS